MNLSAAEFRTADHDDGRTVIMELHAKGLVASFAMSPEQAVALRDGLQECLDEDSTEVFG